MKEGYFLSMTLDKGRRTWYTTEVIKQDPMQEEYLSRCVVDPIKRTVYLYSNQGDEKEVVCETVDEFMSVLEFVRSTVSEDVLSYANPL